MKTLSYREPPFAIIKTFTSLILIMYILFIIANQMNLSYNTENQGVKTEISFHGLNTFWNHIKRMV